MSAQIHRSEIVQLEQPIRLGPDPDPYGSLAPVQHARTAQEVSRENAKVIAFELRNPLTPILGHLDLLRDEVGNISPRVSGRITAMEAKLRWLIDRMVEMAALATDVSLIEPSTCEVGVLVAGAAHSAREFGSWKKINVNVSIVDSPVITIDPALMESALRHILNNAVTFSKRGGTVAIDCSVRENLAVITVSDDGPGMSAEDRERAFELFYRGPSAVEQGLAGFGLGLPRARQIIEAHGGSIAIFPGLTKGTVVEIVLPTACV